MQDETGRQRKLSRPWHGPYRVVAKRDPDVEVSKVYFPQEGNIQIHQSRVKSCSPGFPSGYTTGMELAGRVLGALLRAKVQPVRSKQQGTARVELE